MHDTDSMGGMMTGMGAWMALWAVLGLIVLGLIVTSVIRLTRTHHSHRQPAVPDTSDAPREILRRRYAGGEIDDDEYFSRISALDQP
jgi:putative membrane protein